MGNIRSFFRVTWSITRLKLGLFRLERYLSGVCVSNTRGDGPKQIDQMTRAAYLRQTTRYLIENTAYVELLRTTGIERTAILRCGESISGSLEQSQSLADDLVRQSLPQNATHSVRLLAPRIGLASYLVSHEVQKALHSEEGLELVFTQCSRLVEYLKEDYVAKLSPWEQTLEKDPVGAYPRMTARSKQIYRQAVSEMARRAGRSEADVATGALDLAERGSPSLAPARHLGYYIVAEGSNVLIEHLGGRWRHLAPSTAKLAVLAIVLQGALALALLYAFSIFQFSYTFLGWTVLTIVLYDAITPLAERTLGRIAGRRACLELDMVTEGINDTCKTAIAVPCILSSLSQIDNLVTTLEWNIVAANDDNVIFVVLVDFTDTDSATASELERGLLGSLREKISALRSRLNREDIYFLYRDREYVASENKYMGWDRKRGKLVEFNKLLLDETSSYDLQLSDIDLSSLRGVRYVVCLDEDTRMTRDCLQYLVGAMSHPLNSAKLDRDATTIVRGHGLIVPSSFTRNTSSTKWRFAGWLTGQTLGERSTLPTLRNFLHDYFGRAHFAGKGIYEPAVFQAVCGQLPANKMLSHDTIEGGVLNAGFTDRAVVIDGFPNSLHSYLERLHRWVRGDFQNLLLVLFTIKQKLSPVGKFILFNQVRISITSIFWLVAAVLLLSARRQPESAILFFVIYTLPSTTKIVLNILSARLVSLRTLLQFARGAVYSLGQQMLRFLMIAYQAGIVIDALFLSVYRQINGRRLMDWRAASLVDTDFGGFNRLDVIAVLTSIWCLVLALVCAEESPILGAICLAWATGPWLLPRLLRAS